MGQLRISSTGERILTIEDAEKPDKVTVYLQPGIYRAIKQIALNRGCRPHDLLIEGIDMALAHYKEYAREP
jgi:predicted DNA-binding protein (UPF0278 family)